MDGEQRAEVVKQVIATVGTVLVTLLTLWFGYAEKHGFDAPWTSSEAEAATSPTRDPGADRDRTVRSRTPEGAVVRDHRDGAARRNGTSPRVRDHWDDGR